MTIGRTAAVLSLALLGACAGTEPMTVAPYEPSPAEDNGVLLDRFGMGPASLGYLLIDAETGQDIDALQADTGFIPASTAKIVTTLAALGVLGADHRFTTTLATNAPDGSVPELSGDLYLIGGGDQLLAPADVTALADRLADLGVRSIAGDFYADDSALPRVETVEETQPADAIYNAGVGALSLDFNRSRLAWRPVTATAEASYWRSPPIALPSTPELSNARASGAVWLPVRDPAMFTAEVFRALAGINGIALPPPVRRTAPLSAKAIATVESQPLIDIAATGLEFSNNIVAELIGLAAARRLGVRPKSLRESADALFMVVKNATPSTDWSGALLPNHSGLSATARIAPRQMAAVLRLAESQRFAGRRYRSLLPAAGWRESFDNRLSTPETAMRVWAKTGTMRFATGMAGYLTAASGRRLIFAVYVTDFEARGVYDAQPHPRPESIERAADGWRVRAKALEAEIVRRWALIY